MNTNDIWLIAGLGNPEPKYDGTRHNAGFAALDYLAGKWAMWRAKRDDSEDISPLLLDFIPLSGFLQRVERADVHAPAGHLPCVDSGLVYEIMGKIAGSVTSATAVDAVTDKR